MGKQTLKDNFQAIAQVATLVAVIAQLYLQHYYVQRNEFEAFVAEARSVQSNLVTHVMWGQGCVGRIDGKNAEQDVAIGKLDDRVRGLETRVR